MAGGRVEFSHGGWVEFCQRRGSMTAGWVEFGQVGLDGRRIG